MGCPYVVLRTIYYYTIFENFCQEKSVRYKKKGVRKACKKGVKKCGYMVKYNMKTQKLTPKDKKTIAARVAAGERQAVMVKEYDVSSALISRIVKQSRVGAKKPKSDVPVSRSPIDLSGKTTEQLQNRYRHIHIEILRHNGEIEQRNLEADGLQQSIEAESQKDESVRDEGWILAQKTRLTWCQDTTRTAYELARLYQEASAILLAIGKRDVPVPVGVSIRNGLMPASKME